jgi:hypothetical protein
MLEYIFLIDDIELKIKVEKNDNNQIIIPLYKPTNDFILSHSTLISQAEFETDIQNLLPNHLKGDFFSEINESIFSTIQNHLIKFGRLLEADRDLFVGEAVLIMCSISEALKIQIPEKDERVLIFHMLSEKIKNAMH